MCRGHMRLLACTLVCECVCVREYLYTHLQIFEHNSRLCFRRRRAALTHIPICLQRVLCAAYLPCKNGAVRRGHVLGANHKASEQLCENASERLSLALPCLERVKRDESTFVLFPPSTSLRRARRSPLPRGRSSSSLFAWTPEMRLSFHIKAPECTQWHNFKRAHRRDTPSGRTWYRSHAGLVRFQVTVAHKKVCRLEESKRRQQLPPLVDLRSSTASVLKKKNSFITESN